jgi:hypothetical protein
MQGVAEYDQNVGSPVDDKGEVYYRVKGTDKTFSILFRTNYDNKGPFKNPYLSYLNYSNLATKDAQNGLIFEIPFDENGLAAGDSWTLTGNENYGYWSSYSPPVAWMTSIMDIIGGRKLKHVCMPGSHDAGMSKTNGCTACKSIKINSLTPCKRQC